MTVYAKVKLLVSDFSYFKYKSIVIINKKWYTYCVYSIDLLLMHNCITTRSQLII